jgi:hypothetical protein
MTAWEFMDSSPFTTVLIFVILFFIVDCICDTFRNQ